MERRAFARAGIATCLVTFAVLSCGGSSKRESSTDAASMGGTTDGLDTAATGGTTSTGGITPGSGGVVDAAAAGGTTGTGGIATGSGGTQSANVTVARSKTARVLAPPVTAADAQTLSADNEAFAFAAYHQLKRDSDNLVFSPISISVALAMTYAGAAGNTAAEMATALHFSLPPATLHPAFDALALALASRGQGPLDAGVEPVQLSMVNATWAQQDYVLREDYLDTLAAYYGAGVNLMDFVREPEPSRQLINDWVAEQTEDKIQDLLPPGSISPATVLVLTNAIYFKAAWMHPFPPEQTFDREFTRLDGTQVTTKMMSNGGMTRALATADLKAIALPYQDERLSLLVVVPEPGAFDTVEAALGGPWLDDIVAGLTLQDAGYSIPRFTINTSAPVKDALMALGMKAAFEGSADFSGIDGTRRLVVQDVLHKAFIAVGEKGTEAAAATGVIVGGNVPKFSLLANRPFFYFLRDEPTGAILFMGRVMDPTR
jgi:serpin B